jgi:5-methylcytosine-specific restriction endonuclease McrA
MELDLAMIGIDETSKKYHAKTVQMLKDPIGKTKELFVENRINTLRRDWRFRTPNARRHFRRNNTEPGNYSDADVLSTYGLECHICQTPIDLNASRQVGKDGWEKGLHIDHVYPLSKGGLDTIENVRPSHGQCNIIKWATV